MVPCICNCTIYTVQLQVALLHCCTVSASKASIFRLPLSIIILFHYVHTIVYTSVCMYIYTVHSFNVYMCMYIRFIYSQWRKSLKMRKKIGHPSTPMPTTNLPNVCIGVNLCIYVYGRSRSIYLYVQHVCTTVYTCGRLITVYVLYILLLLQ